MTIKCDRRICNQNAIVTISTFKDSNPRYVLSRSLTSGINKPKNKTKVNYCLNHYPTKKVEKEKVLQKPFIDINEIEKNNDFNNKYNVHIYINFKQQYSRVNLQNLSSILDEENPRTNPMEKFANYEISAYVDNYFK